MGAVVVISGTLKINIGLIFFFILFAISSRFFLGRSIIKPLQRIAIALSRTSDKVGSSSQQISSSSQQLAEGASEQAAALEETSSSLEEMSSMTRQNADNSNQANLSMGDTSRVIDAAKDSMEELKTSMMEISQASEDTQRIIKTIDEIAFQANLLALNAAVEAARAGEAGAGFAVVADEVRNLAMRAAEAARSTAELIEGTVKKVKTGSEIVMRAGEAFESVAAGSRKVNELVGEISAASSEQAQGIDQVNRAVSEMDKVVQQNAANAEETASASSDMNAQAQELRGFVLELVQVVGAGSVDLGGEAHEGAPGTVGSRRRVDMADDRRAAAVPRALPRPMGKEKGNGTALPGHHRSVGPRPDQAIPFGDQDLHDF